MDCGWALAALLAMSGGRDGGEAPPAPAGPEVKSGQHDTSPPLRDLKVPPHSPERRVHPWRRVPHPGADAGAPAKDEPEQAEPVRPHKKKGPPPHSPRKPPGEEPK